MLDDIVALPNRLRNYEGREAIVSSLQCVWYPIPTFNKSVGYYEPDDSHVTCIGSDIILPEDDTDDVFSKSEVKGQQLDLAVGLYYKRGPWYVGASVLHLNAPTVEMGETNEISIDRTYYFTAGYNIKLRNPFLTIHPTAMFKYDGVGYRGDVTARLQYTHEKKMFYAGVGYSPTNSVTAYIGGSLHGVNIGYSYEMYTGGISIGNGSHELCIRYQTDINLVKKGKNKHKSVRIL